MPYINDIYKYLAFTHTSAVVTLCSIKKKRILNKDGSYTEKDILPVNMALDHRYFDGAIAAKVMREVKYNAISIIIILVNLSIR